MHSATDEIPVICPECNNLGGSGKFKSGKCNYNPAKDVWNCFRCGAKGAGLPDKEAGHAPTELTKFEELQSVLISCLEQAPVAQEYLTKRLGGSKDWRIFALGYDPDKNAISIPVYDHDSKLIGIKYRYIADRDMRYAAEPGTQGGLYVIPFPGSEPELLICEGEFDAMSAYLMNFNGTIAAVQTNQLSKDTIPRLKKWLTQDPKRIYVVPDLDDAGEKLCEQISGASFSKDILCIVRDGDRRFKDLSERLEKLGIDAASESFKQLLASAQLPLEAETYTPFDKIDETWNFLSDAKNTLGISTGFSQLDTRLGGGWFPYTLTALSAPAKTGKTTLVVSLIHSLVSRDIKVGFISLEMSGPKEIIPTLFSIAIQNNIRKLRRKSEDLLLIAFDEIKNNKTYLKNLSFFDRRGSTPAEDLSAWIKFQYEHHGVTMFFLDHVGYSLMDIKDPSEHSKLSKTLRHLTSTYPIHLVAIVQPRSLQNGAKFVTKNDLYGSITWSQDVNQILTLERLSEENQSNLRLMDSHNQLAKPSENPIALLYNPETCQLSEIADSPRGSLRLSV